MIARAMLVSVCGASLLGCTTPNPAFDVDDDGAGSTGASVSATGRDDSGGQSASADDEATDSDPTSGGETTGGPDASCGNGQQEEGEQCDEGEKNSPVGACQLDCTANECGDGEVGPGQPCDDGPVGSPLCSPECVPTSCGDGQVQGRNGEECEPEIDSHCTPACTENVCGDGFPLDGEDCDDGNPDNTDECVACVAAACGDNFVRQGVEECDDGNPVNEDSCLVDCTFNDCGDGFIDVREEQCDGELADTCVSLGFDGGEPSCGLECTIQGCTTCNDGTLEGDEECEPSDFAAMSCATANLLGTGNVECDEQTCVVVVTSGDCCTPGGQDCSASVGCCQGCDNLTGLCLGE